MKKINHHPTDETLFKYVTGQYDTAYNLVLASHVSQCVCCQNTVAVHQEMGGEVLRHQAPTKMKRSAMDLLDQPSTGEPIVFERFKTDRSESFGISTPNILSRYLESGLDDIKWQRLTKDLKQYVISVSGKATVRLLWMAPGKAVPAHGHQGEEMTYVLSGGYYDGDEAYTEGDLHIADHRSPHVPTAMEDKPCLVLAATDQPLVFSNIIPRLFQPFYKI